VSVAPPSVTVVTPNTRITLKFKSTYNVTWLVNSGSKVQSHTIDLSLDGGLTWRNVVTGLRGDLTTYAWRVPNTATTNARIRVKSTLSSGQSGRDMSDTSFIISR
jgi:hypothetical protein